MYRIAFHEGPILVSGMGMIYWIGNSYTIGQQSRWLGLLPQYNSKEALRPLAYPRNSWKDGLQSKLKYGILVKDVDGFPCMHNQYL